jgi:DNA/RNA endonuclease YhcR with UshA esterase domain
MLSCAPVNPKLSQMNPSFARFRAIAFFSFALLCLQVAAIATPAKLGAFIPLLTPSVSSLTDFGTVNNGLNSASQTFTFSGSGLTDIATVSAPDYFQVSRDNATFKDTLMFTLAQATAGVSVFIRFAPTSGSVVLSTPGGTNASVSVSGTEAGNLNITPIASLRSAVNSNCVANTIGNVTVRGQIYGVNPRTLPQFSYSVLDNTGAITFGIFSNATPTPTFTGVTAGTLLEGQNVTITGAVVDFNGLMEIIPTAIALNSTGNARKAPTDVTVLDEVSESDLVTIREVAITNTSQWIGNAAYSGSGFNVSAVAGGNPIVLRITGPLSKKTYAEVFSTATTNITITGLGGQFQTAANKCTGGYQLSPYLLTDITYSTTPTLTLNPSTPISLPTTVEAFTSPIVSYRLGGSFLTADIGLSVSGAFAISLDSVAFASSLTAAQVAGNVNRKIFVRFEPTASGGASGTITHTSTGATSVQLNLSGTAVAAGTPVLSASVGTLNFGSASSGTATSGQSYQLSTTNAANLTAPVTITAPTQYQVSKDDVPANYTSSISYTSAEMASARPVWVRFAPVGASAPANSAVSNTSTGVLTLNVAVTGFNTGSATALNYYYGNLHAHTCYSDGKNASTTPATAYGIAKTALHMDFLGISDHNHAAAGQSAGTYALGVSQALAATTSTFVGLYGMEYGVISGGGHIALYGIDKLIGWDNINAGDIFVAKSDYTGTSGLFKTVADRIDNATYPNAFATLCHPSSGDYNGYVTSTLSAGTPSTQWADKVVKGCTIRSGPAFSTSTSYSDRPNSTYLSTYNTALSRGYHLGPNLDHDTHEDVYGKQTRGRTVVLAPALTQNDILQAYRQRRIYASDDWNAKVDFKVNGQVMGSEITEGVGSPSISITVTDDNGGTIEAGQATGLEASTQIQILAGTPGSGSSPTPVRTFTSTASGTTVNYSDAALANGATRYYYLIISQADGDQIWTAPIWYTRNDAAGGGNVVYATFTGVQEAGGVRLNWSTSSETNNARFQIERSFDNTTFTSIGTQNGQGTTTAPTLYSFLDNTFGTATTVYYRLRQIDFGGIEKLNSAILVNVTTANEELSASLTSNAQWVAFPNPITTGTELQIVYTGSTQSLSELVSYQLISASGSIVLATSTSVLKVSNAVSSALSGSAPGLYLLQFTSGLGQSQTLRLVKN